MQINLQATSPAAASGSRSPASSATASVDLGTKTIGARRDRRVRGHDRASTSRSLWSPQDPHLYDVSFTVRVGGQQGRRLHAAQRDPLDQGLQRAARPQRPATSTSAASACTRTPRRRASRSTTRAASSCVNDAKELGATVLRTHYPLHPYTHELADRLGLLIWSEIPVYSVKTEVLKEPAVRRLAVEELEQEHRRQREPPVGDAVVDRQRALLAARAGAGRLHQRGGQVRQGDGPDAPGRPRRRRLPELALPGGRSTSRSTCSASTTTSAGTRARAARSSTARSSPATSTRPAPATRTRR